MNPTLEILTGQIVVLGNFNPPVITPAWLLSQELIGKESADFALSDKNLVITPEISRFETDWCSLQVMEEQFILTSTGALSPALKDLAIGIFTLLAHTPVRAVGINCMTHYKMPTLDAYHRVGDVFAPKNIWQKFFPETDSQHVGLENMTMLISPNKRGKLIDKSDFTKRVSLSRSDKIAGTGIKLVINDHCPLEGGDDTDAEKVVELLTARWEQSMQESQRILKGLIDAVAEQP